MFGAVHIPQDQQIALTLLLQRGQRLTQLIETALQGGLIGLKFRLGLQIKASGGPSCLRLLV